ncbi:phytanoyl-CoA dioxygenase family protein [Chroococcidiopsis sp. TS-821]|uniref:phytanoyl-CoA dioxygenase family protein n=1 Tax=Chroococcidiopsis sp. TS-821 TaxID=1378066 RepID=UPI000CEE2DAC|nr:phytanoyl-CoA dioxygenase family protein [Chroococcidiopsis sp. TS-821]PPS45131.1 phytanoyl-CoA dioxygenase family protein [Chroococcidiopsis sp. TS-821]
MIKLTTLDINKFNNDGFLVIPQLIDADLVARLIARIEPLFSGEFETGIYPDEWYWRPGLSLPDVTREMCNVWKSDLTIASVVLSAEIGRLSATLAGWNGARIGQDSLWWKPAGGKEVALHQDATYIKYIDPPEMITCWIALDDTSADAGTIEYVRGSHKWRLLDRVAEFHAPTGGYRAQMLQAAAEMGISNPEIVQVEIPAGGCVFHHGNAWHGSGKNTRTDKVRRSLGVHTLSSEAKFRPTGAGYIYGRYQRVGDTTMDESFFPILWTKNGDRTPFLADYCKDALAKSRVLVG